MGNFWRKLCFKIENHGKIINAACYLHNFFIDERLRNIRKQKDDDDFIKNYDHTKDDFMNSKAVGAFPLVTDNNERSAGGRPRLDDRGEAIRNNMASNLRTDGLYRPLQNGMKYNMYGNIYMEY